MEMTPFVKTESIKGVLACLNYKGLFARTSIRIRTVHYNVIDEDVARKSKIIYQR